MYYYQHHIGDFLKDTSNLSNEQLAVYLKMLWRYYLDETPFIDAPEDIAFAVRSDEKTVQLILKHFFVEQEDGWHQTRCNKEIKHFHDKGEKARNSANARWKNANALPTQSERNASATKNNANQEPITKNQSIKASRLPQDFAMSDEWKVWARNERSDIDVESQAESFKDYWLSKGGKDACKTNWMLTWRNWVRNAKTSYKKPNNVPENRFPGAV